MNFGQFIFEKQNYGRAQNRAFRRRPTSDAAFTPHRRASMKQVSLSSRNFAKTLWARMLASFGRSAWTDQACRSSCSRSRLKTLWSHWCDADSALNEEKKTDRLPAHRCRVRPQWNGRQQPNKCVPLTVIDGKVENKRGAQPGAESGLASKLPPVKSECKHRCPVAFFFWYFRNRTFKISGVHCKTFR